MGELEGWLDRYTDYLADGEGTPPNLKDLSPSLRKEARRQAFIVSELWGRDAGPGDGPSTLASAFGFDRLDETAAVDGTKIRAARQAAGLKVSALARELTRLGWTVSAAELGEIESGKRPDIPGTAVPLLVTYLSITAEDFTTTATAKVDQLMAIARIRALIEDAAERLGRPFEEISSLVRPQLAGAHFREHDSQEDDVAEVVQNILDRIN